MFHAGEYYAVYMIASLENNSTISQANGSDVPDPEPDSTKTPEELEEIKKAEAEVSEDPKVLEMIQAFEKVRGLAHEARSKVMRRLLPELSHNIFMDDHSAATQLVGHYNTLIKARRYVEKMNGSAPTGVLQLINGQLKRMESAMDFRNQTQEPFIQR